MRLTPAHVLLARIGVAVTAVISAWWFPWHVEIAQATGGLECGDYGLLTFGFGLHIQGCTMFHLTMYGMQTAVVALAVWFLYDSTVQYSRRHGH